MSLTLPEDVGRHLTTDQKSWAAPGVYCLTLTVPSDVRERWENNFEHTPDYLDMVEAKPNTAYIGAAANVMSRIEDHANGDVRKVALLEVCDIDELRNIWWFDSKEKAFQQERTMADLLSRQKADWYIHQR